VAVVVKYESSFYTGTNFQIELENSIVFGQVSAFQLEYEKRPTRNWELSIQKIYFNTDRISYLLGKHCNTISQETFLYFQLENEIICGKFSTFGQRIHKPPTSVQMILFPFEMSQLSG